MTSELTYYQILGLPGVLQQNPIIPAQTLRSAYRRALLQNHPDKSKFEQSWVPSTRAIFSIDQISQAFSTLSDPALRKVYDKELREREITVNAVKSERQGFLAGVEVMDLDDLNTSEAEGTWYRGCRCGDSRGFLIREADLEVAAEDGELNVGCAGCSLWLKVLFSIVEDAPANTDKVEETKG